MSFLLSCHSFLIHDIITAGTQHSIPIWKVTESISRCLYFNWKYVIALYKISDNNVKIEGKPKFFGHLEHRDQLQKYPQRNEHMVNAQQTQIKSKAKVCCQPDW